MKKLDPEAAILESRMDRTGGLDVIRLQRRVTLHDEKFSIYTLQTFRGQDEIRFDCFTAPNGEIGPNLPSETEFDAIFGSLVFE